MVQGIKNKDIQRFKNACERLQKVMSDIQAYNPEAHIFVNMDDLELHGKLYDSDKEFHFAEAVVSVHIDNTDCGER